MSLAGAARPTRRDADGSDRRTATASVSASAPTKRQTPVCVTSVARRLQLAPRVVAHAQRLHRIQILARLDRARRRALLARLRDGDVHRVLAVVVRVAVRVALRRPSGCRRCATSCPRTDSPASIRRPAGAGTCSGCRRRRVGRFHRRHHAIGDRALRVEKRLHRVRHDFTGAQDVALNRVVDLGARHAALNVLRDVAVRQARMSGAAALEIEDAELPRLERRDPALSSSMNLRGSVPF